MSKFYCCVEYCFTKQGNGIAMHQFPTVEPLRKQWIDFVRATKRDGWNLRRTNRICSLHFEANCFMQNPRYLAQFGFATNRVRLEPNAIPSIYPAICRPRAKAATAAPKHPRREFGEGEPRAPTSLVQMSLERSFADPIYMPTNSGQIKVDAQTQCAVAVASKTAQVAMMPGERTVHGERRRMAKNIECQTDL
ncbi:uncharacterized protein LOC142572917 isoform X1 [Dermacentor variabilis]|uniref:uncharacterized protein LOC142572917 isoform X1 n=2 Tax=Dermacentor variabilis TaxID=34621 RepID=UPI003F5B095E